MKFISYLISTLFVLQSCSTQYNIAGNSTLSTLDGNTVYLRVMQGENKLHDIDSCQIIHGKFSFIGKVDSVIVAQISTDDHNMMPVVLEDGNLSIEVDNIRQRVSGGPLNDKLYEFIEQKNRLINEQWEIDQLCLRMMREGKSVKEIHDMIGLKSKEISDLTEKLETKFIMDNYENALGPAGFALIFGQYPVPIMTEQIQQIINMAPSSFLRNPNVNRYVKEARINSSRSYEQYEENRFDTAP